jgi:membrane protein DedA with SNARE-associated domain
VSGIVQSLTAWLFEHTYAVVFIATLVDATAIPFPGRIILAAAGALAASGDTSLTLVIMLGSAGVVITDHLWYFAGSLGGDRLLRLYCRLTFSSRECVARTGDWLQRFGPLVILVGRFVAVVRVLAWPPARQHGVGYLTFVAIEVPAALLWTGTWVGLGWLLGDRWAQASSETRWLGIGVAVVAAVAFVGFRLWRRARATGRTGTAAPAFRGSPEAPRARPHP